ncbi:MAG: TonB-dependent receptor [Kordiimonadaceae bacterium]|nr:TonB-dependent receptor [Kordiimonadaceae bacterium]
MSHYNLLKNSSALLTISLISSISIPVLAQDVSAGAEVDTIYVTGSYIKRQTQENSPSPLNVMTSGDISAQGINVLSDLARNMTFNAGSELNTDAFTQNFSTGTGNINLRNLGLSSTLILINGKRQTLSAAYADDGSTFVDTNSIMPLIMVDRVETLKDGGSAIYGTDAVAGVVNYITRKKFTGFEMQTGLQSTTSDSQRDYDISAIWGSEFGNNGNFVIAGSFMHRSNLTAADRSEITAGSGISGSGQPGTIYFRDQVPAPGGVGSAGDANSNGFLDAVPVIDPYCGTAPNSSLNSGNMGSVGPLEIGGCNFQFDSYYDLVPEEDRIQMFSSIDTDIGDNMHFYLEGGITNNKAVRNNAPSFPIASPVPVALINPATSTYYPHIPAELQGAATALGGLTSVLFVGRVLGDNGGSFVSNHDNDTYRVAAVLDGEVNERWTWETSANFSKSKFAITVDDVKRDDYINALLTGAYNPFGTAHTTHPNSQAAIDAITANMNVQGNSDLFTVDAHVNGDLVEFGGNMVQVAFGGQFRSEKMNYDWSEDYNGPNGDGSNGSNLANLNGGNLMFLYGGPDYGGERDVYALFGELAVPIGETLDLQIAARYEDYGSGINSFDPKISALWRPDETLSVRASFSTAFRAPSLYNVNGVQTALNEITLGTTSTFLPVRSTGNSNLSPENSDVYNIGFTWNAVENFSIGLDYWRYDFTNLITQENSQSVVNKALVGDTQALSQLHFNTPGDLTTLFLIDTNIINAPTVSTDGLDFNMAYSSDLSNFGGQIHSGLQATYIFNYDAVDQSGVSFEGVGSRNFNNFARSMPEWRVNYNIGYSDEYNSANVFVRYINGYTDDQNAVEVPSYTTVDLQYTYAFNGTDEIGLRATIGMVNAFNKQVPKLSTNGGFDSKVHDPRQRMMYMKLGYRF